MHDLDAGMLVTVQIRRGTGRDHCRERVTAAILQDDNWVKSEAGEGVSQRV